MGVVGEHKDFPVENLSLSHCRKYLASCSHDQTIKFWNVENIDKETVNTYRRKAKKDNKLKPLNNTASNCDFFADLTTSDAPGASSSKDKAADGSQEDSSADSDNESGKEMSANKTPSENQSAKCVNAETDESDDDGSFGEDIAAPGGCDSSDSSSEDD